MEVINEEDFSVCSVPFVLQVLLTINAEIL